MKYRDRQRDRHSEIIVASAEHSLLRHKIFMHNPKYIYIYYTRNIIVGEL